MRWPKERIKASKADYYQTFRRESPQRRKKEGSEKRAWNWTRRNQQKGGTDKISVCFLKVRCFESAVRSRIMRRENVGFGNTVEFGKPPWSGEQGWGEARDSEYGWLFWEVAMKDKESGAGGGVLSGTTRSPFSPVLIAFYFVTCITMTRYF